jgi:hypothetical protein
LAEVKERFLVRVELTFALDVFLRFCATCWFTFLTTDFTVFIKLYYNELKYILYSITFYQSLLFGRQKYSQHSKNIQENLPWEL